MSTSRPPTARQKRKRAKPRLYCVVSGKFYYFSVDHLAAIEPLAALVQLPFSEGDLAGLSVTDGVALPVFQVGRSVGASLFPPRVTLRVRTSKGDIRLLAENVSGSPLMEEKDYANGADLAEQLVASLHAPASTEETGGIARSENSPDVTIGLLIVRSGASCYALPVAPIVQIERPEMIEPLRRGQVDDVMIGLAEQTLAGKSLARLIGEAADLPSETIAICFDAGGCRLGLVVESVIGIQHVEAAQLQRLQVGDRAGFWFRDAQLGTIECLSLTDVFGSFPDGRDLAAPWEKLETRPRRSVSLTPDMQRPAAWVALRIGPYNFFLPDELIVEVMGKIERGNLKQAGRPGHLAAYDVTPVLLPERADQVAKTWAAICIRKVEGQCVFLAEDLFALEKNLPWHPAPALPPVLQCVTESIRIREGKAEFLLKRNFLEQIPPDLLAEMTKKSLRGWIRQFRSEPANGHVS